MKNLVIRVTMFATVLLILSSCSGELDPQFCKCLEATDNMDVKSSNYMGGYISEEEWREVEELSNTMRSSCKDYAEISIEDELRLKEQCENH